MPGRCSTYAEKRMHRRTVELVQPSRRVARTDDVKDIIRNLQNSPTTAFLRSLSLHEQILLAALLRCVRHTGVCEISWADVSHQHHLYAGVFVDSALLPHELWNRRRSSAYLGKWAVSTGGIYLPWSSLRPSCTLLECCSSTVFTVVFYCSVSTEE